MGAQVHTQGESVDIECDPEVIARRTELFNRYILPFTNMIFKLCAKYSANSNDVQENYSEALTNFYRRIETYDSSRPIRAWIHTCVKHQVWASDRRRQVHNNKDFDNDIEDYEEELIDDDHVSSNVMGVDNWKEMYSQDIVEVIEELPARHRNALILQEAGYSLREIAEIEYANGLLKTLSMDTIKSRLRFARQHLKNNITRDGTRIPRPTDIEDVP